MIGSKGRQELLVAEAVCNAPLRFGIATAENVNEMEVSGKGGYRGIRTLERDLPQSECAHLVCF